MRPSLEVNRDSVGCAEPAVAVFWRAVFIAAAGAGPASVPVMESTPENRRWWHFQRRLNNTLLAIRPLSVVLASAEGLQVILERWAALVDDS